MFKKEIYNSITSKVNMHLLLIAAILGLFAIFAGCAKENVQAGVGISPNNGVFYNIYVAKTPLLSTDFNSNMVIQRNKPCILWGHAAAGKKVEIRVSWNKTPFSDVANSAGMWQVQVPATAATSVPQSISCVTTDSIPVNLNNILIGDVWICSGQSNMATTLTILADSTAQIAAANYPGIRVATVTRDFEKNPIDMLPRRVNWNVCTPQNANAFSAVAYFFGRKLNTTLNVPIGLVVTAVGSTRCEYWTSAATLTTNPLFGTYPDTLNSQLYNAMLYPLRNLAITGFIWYQGEGNRHDIPASRYTALNAAMIGNWRTLFNQGSLPFYYVEIAPFDTYYSSITGKGGNPANDSSAYFREAQANIRGVAANTGMAVTMDVGDSTDLHPRDKAPVGIRLALLALHYNYGQNVQCLGPQYQSYTLTSPSTATVSFIPATTADGSLMTNLGAPIAQYFFVAGTDNVFRQATAVISGQQILLTASPDTPLPIQAIRYAFTDYPITNLQNAAGLPMEPFRTDDFGN